MITSYKRLGLNLILYAIGVGMSVAGALGLVQQIELQFLASSVLFLVGLVIVIAVHEGLDGPF